MKYTWYKEHINTNAKAKQMAYRYLERHGEETLLDTETTGLHIMRDKPFLVQWGYFDHANNQGFSYCVDIEKQPRLADQVIRFWLKMSNQAKRLIIHNAKFDLHMLRNGGYEYRTENVTDTMFYIRHAHDAIPERFGGVPLGLKNYAARYIDPQAKHHETLLNAEKTAMASNFNRELLKVYLKGRKMKDLKSFFNDILNEPEDLPEADRVAYFKWREWLPRWLDGRFDVLVESDSIPYNKLPRELVIRYALDDIVWMGEIFLATDLVVQVRQTQNAIDLENSMILPFLDMEAVGFAVNKEYLNHAKTTLKQYIRSRRKDLARLAGAPIKVNQNAVVLRLLQDRFNILCQSTEAEELSRLASDLRHTGENPDGADFITTLQELRTLEKWYSTYLLRFIRSLSDQDRLYTQINQVGTVSGRVTSDFQQFPKDAIVSTDGRELFHPRRLVRVSGGEYDALVYLDYSQIELRLQALYTILVSEGDTNLCRAYMPFRCVDSQGVRFCPENLDHVRRWHEPWFLEEDPSTPWKPVDVHGATAITAFDTSPEDMDYKHYRSLGKRINFAKNYGAQFGRIKAMFPEFTDEQIRKIDQAYYLTFPGVRDYHRYCERLAMLEPYAENLFGIKYYNVSGHNLINMLIQGSGAFLLKLKIREIWEYSQANKIKSRMQMTIHDENSWERHKDDDMTLFYKFKQIMETWEDTLVPIVSEMEITYTTWADKQAVKITDEMR